MKSVIHGIEVDYSRDVLFDELGLKRLRESYMRDDEKSPQERFAFVSSKFASNPEHAQRLYDYASKHWLSYATPILSFGKSKNGLPISCFLNYIPDTAQGLVDNLSETNWLSMMGGGVGTYFGIRSASDKSTGVMPHLKIYDASTLAYRQGKSRRGSYAAYLDISHPDIIQFLEMRKPTGDQNMKCLNMHHGICIPDSFMNILENCMKNPDYDDTWELKDPASNIVKETISAKYLWQLILELRIQTGEPYLLFSDNINNQRSPWQIKNNQVLTQSNLCTEIIEFTSEERTAVCCLSSLNLEYYNDWKDNYLFHRDVLEMLDNVLQYFIDNAPDAISRARYSAQMERSVGVGALGFHSYLQKEMIPFDSIIAKFKNEEIFSGIKEKLDKATKELAVERGEPQDLIGFGVRNSNMIAIAPNASSSLIMGNTSPSIEPMKANAYRQDTLSGAFLNKNRFLDKLIKEACEKDKKLDYQDIWSSIIANEGSCQHLEFLDEYTRSVFKTAMELDQRWIIELAADRQKYIDQSQSVNLFFRPDVNIKYLHGIHFMAWKHKMKTLYYCRSEKILKGAKVGNKIERSKIEEIDLNQIIEGADCVACEG
jgi:ribonucleoside-diphosphate reductase alpha chain